LPVRLDPLLTASAVAHLLENAAQYAPAGSTIQFTIVVPAAVKKGETAPSSTA
jgi:hypothetical protein